MLRFRLPALLALLLLPACLSSQPFIDAPYQDWQTQNPPPDADLAYQVFLLGNAGSATTDATPPALALLRQRLRTAGPASAVVLLGDQVYCCGLADSSLTRRAQDEQRLRSLLAAGESYAGRLVILPGDHDWDDHGPDGAAAVQRMERFTEAHGEQTSVLPNEAFPGPVEVPLTEHLVLVALDTQWWLHPHDKPYGDAGDYDLEEDADFLLQLDDLIKRRDDETLLIVGHHPMVSNGVHAGRLPLRDHLFPLRRLHPALLLPLPLLGSAYPLYRQYVGGPQDLAHPRYRTLRTALSTSFGQHERLVYAAAHDRSLQFFPMGDQQYVVSGAGGEAASVGRGRGAAFTAAQPGFSVLNYYRDGTLWMEMWAADGTADGTLLFRTELFGPQADLVDPQLPSELPTRDFRDSTAMLAANPGYAAGPLKAFVMGSHNRAAWTTPIRVPVLDLGREAGGLTPLKRGGGLQTTSLRLQGGDGHQYVLRTIDKDPSRTVPVNLQGTVATDIVQDQITTIHPYGAFIIPRLADAAGLYHTNPQLRYVPDDPRLGIYKETFAGTLVMFEERPDDDQSDVPSFGRAHNVIGDEKLYREISGDNDHRVDAPMFLRARLFDMWLSDWDRHAGQWRWAAFEPYELDPSLTGEARTEGKIYRPIPRDRDFAFNKLNGLFPPLISFLDPKFQDFSEGYGNLKGLNLNGMPQDRRLLAGLDRAAWLAIAADLQAALTDEVIEAGVRDWPEPIFALDGEETIRLLKRRRDQLPEVAASYYALLARVVDVVGSDKHERFEVTRLDDDRTRVVVYKTSKKGEIRKPIYARTFLHGETKELRLYGLDGQDTFLIEGNVGRGPTVLVIGGPGEDTFIDRSRVGGLGRRTHIYDTDTGNTWETGPEARTVRTDDDPAIHEYRFNAYQYDLLLPLLFFGSNPDDGLFVGGGVNVVRHGFRKTPFARTHRVKANVAARTGAFNVVYAGQLVDALGAWDVTLDAAYLSPNNIRNFYGLGNETENTEDDREFYQARLTQARLAPALLHHLDAGAALSLGPTFQVTRVRADEDRFVAAPQPGVSARTFDDQWFGGLAAGLTMETVDRPVNPRLGFRWTNEVAVNLGLRNATDPFSRLATDLTLYVSPSLSPQLTLALRAGAAHNIGDFPFYSANTLGGAENLRGFRSTRFAGRTSFFQNAEVRLHLLSFSTYLAIGRAGLLGFVDNGRVWTEADDATGAQQAFLKGYHQGYGGGAWVELFNLFILNGTYGLSADDRTFTLGLGFQY